MTEPNAGSDTTQIEAFAERAPNGRRVRRQKIWTSRAQHSDLLLLLARTTPRDRVERRRVGLPTFIVDMEVARDRLRITPIRTMMNHATTEVFFNDVELSADALVGEEGWGFATSSTA